MKRNIGVSADKIIQNVCNNNKMEIEDAIKCIYCERATNVMTRIDLFQGVLLAICSTCRSDIKAEERAKLNELPAL